MPLMAEPSVDRARLIGQMDAALKIEPTDRVQAKRCPCCGLGYTSVSGTVFRGQNAYASYKAALFLRHPTRKVVVAVGLAGEDERVAVALHAWPSHEGVDMGLVEPPDPALRDAQGIGHFLRPREALRSPLRDEFFRVASHVCGTDPVLSAFLRSSNS